jgi:hypothetical protein
MNSLQQQARFDDFLDEFNTERPREALKMQRPADLYTPSSHPYDGLPDVTRPAVRLSERLLQLARSRTPHRLTTLFVLLHKCGVADHVRGKDVD